MLELYNGALDVDLLITKWYNEEKKENYGAYIPFVGTVRSEDNINGLSFDIYEPILEKWFNAWQEKAKKKELYLKWHILVEMSYCINQAISLLFFLKNDALR